MDRIRTRFAPSPTGFMHVGNLRTALYAYLLARAGKGDFVLRIEDTDQARYVPGAVEVIYQTLRAAGLEHDEGPDKDGGYGPYVQSERKNLYRKYAEELVAKGAAYYCFCDKTDDSDGAEGVSTGYDGRCRKLSEEEVRANLAAGKPYVIRQKIDRSGVSTFSDAVFGDIAIENKVLDDQILLKRDGMPTYNFANVVDDHLMAISHVVRGSEYLPSTPKYNLLYRAFGWEIPTYVHLPLIMGKEADGTVAKLSKRHGSVSFENLTAEGYLPEAIVNYIALLGWSPKNDREIFSLSELENIFSVAGLNKSPAVFDYDKLKWMNGEYLRSLTPEVFAERAKPFAGALLAGHEAQWPLIAAMLQPRLELLGDIPGKLEFLGGVADFAPELYNNKKSKSSPENARTNIAAALEVLPGVAEWNNDALFAALNDCAGRLGVKTSQMMWALRVGVSGLAVTPGGATELMAILGSEESRRRLEEALKRLQA